MRLERTCICVWELPVSTHRTKYQDRPLILKCHRRDQGVKRAFARRNDIGVGRVDREVRTPIVKGDPRAGRDDQGAKSLEKTLNAGDEIALPIRDGKIRRPLNVRWRFSDPCGLSRIDPAAQGVGVLL